jgi:hypothetical protein
VQRVTGSDRINEVCGSNETFGPDEMVMDKTGSSDGDQLSAMAITEAVEVVTPWVEIIPFTVSV